MSAFKKYIFYSSLVIATALIMFIGFKALVEPRDSYIELLQNEVVLLKEEKQSLTAELIKANETATEYKSKADDKDDIFQLQGLVEVREVDSTIVVDLIYATKNNFTGQVLYDLEVCLLQKITAEKLAAVNAEVALKGYRLKVWDAFRPKSAQVIMWNYAPNGVYVTDPSVGSNHNRGASVDVTLVDQFGNELEMPTGFDDFSAAASRDYANMSAEARKNVDYLTEVMVKKGFTPIQSEWWHFNDAEYKSYPFIDLSLEVWVNSYFAN